MNLTLLGISHRTAPVELRERLSIEPAKLADAVRTLLGVPGVQEGIIISTCNRLEVLVYHGSQALDLSRFLVEYFSIPKALVGQYTYEYRGINAAQHLFRVSSSLDSLVIGEPQILGQVKDAYTVARSIGAVGPGLERLLQSAFSIAKKVRRETRIGNASVSVASVSIELVRKIFGSLDGLRILLVGAGKMSEIAASQLVAQGAEPIMIANRTYEHAVNLAARFRGRVVQFADVYRAASEADVVITSTGSPQYIFRHDHGLELMKLRKDRPLLFVDIAVPRDVDPALCNVKNVFVRDIDCLQSVAMSHQEERKQEAEKAEMIVAQEAIRYQTLDKAINVGPIIRRLQEEVEMLAQKQLSRAASSLASLSTEEHRAMELALRSAMNKLLHPVILSLRQAAEVCDQEKIETICSLFSLETAPYAKIDGSVEEAQVPKSLQAGMSCAAH
jgi:glutamyl-tRNA reductase